MFRVHAKFMTCYGLRTSGRLSEGWEGMGWGWGGCRAGREGGKVQTGSNIKVEKNIIEMFNAK